MKSVTIPIPDLTDLMWRNVHGANGSFLNVATMCGLRLTVEEHEGEPKYGETPYCTWSVDEHDRISLMGPRIRLHDTEGQADTPDQAFAAAHKCAVEILESALGDLMVRS